MTTNNNTAVIRQLERDIELLREENKALRCKVERLRCAGRNLFYDNELAHIEWITVEKETPTQSLAAVRAEAVEGFIEYMNADDTWKYSRAAKRYAQKLRTGGDNE